MKVIVAGGAGFIGSHLCEALMDDGHQVICIDNFVTGHISNIAHNLSNPDFTLVEADITEKINLEPADYVFNLASPASPIDFSALVKEILLVNSVGTMNLLEYCKETGARFLQASTSEAYGEPEVHPQPESYRGNVNPVGPRSCYDEGKRFSEAATMSYCRAYGVDCRVVRIFNTYGPRMRFDDGRVIPSFIYNVINDKPIEVFGDGSQTRSFCFVSDLVRGIMAAMFTEGIRGEVFNLGNPDEKTIVDVAGIVMSMMGKSIDIVQKPLPVDDPTRRRPDITKAKSVLNWEPEISLETGLQITIEWFNEVNKICPVVR